MFKRIGKGGREVFIQASYNPILDRSGKPFKVVKFATDVTKETMRNADYVGQIDAIGKAQAVIEFNLDGTIITANENFLKTMGYTLAEVQGKHHSMFVEAAYRENPEYKAFWAALGRGEFQAAEYKRVGKGGKEIFIQASYNPIFDMTGKPFKVVKFATDITQDKLRNADYIGQIDAIGKSQAVIEFKLDGTIITANANFLSAMGYTLGEIQGKHHSMFVEPSYRDSAEYANFWASLGRGEFQAAEYKRIAKGNREIYIQASYNPILDMNGKPFKVVKYASDVTQQVIARKKSEHVRSMMESVAAGAEELNASVKEIAESMIKSKDTANGAAERVELADHSTLRLNEAAQSMGGIVELINNITSQIDLLALNATIEFGARGRGRQGLCRRRQRGQEPGRSGEERDRADLQGDRRHARHLDRRRDRARQHQAIDRGGARIRHLHRRRGRGTERRRQRDVGQHAEGSRRGQQHRPGGVTRKPHLCPDESGRRPQRAAASIFSAPLSARRAARYQCPACWPPSTCSTSPVTKPAPSR